MVLQHKIEPNAWGANGVRGGLPLVATRSIGADEVVVGGETGVLVPIEDSDALGAALADVLADPGMRDAYGAAGRRRYLDRFTAEHMVARTTAASVTCCMPRKLRWPTRCPTAARP